MTIGDYWGLGELNSIRRITDRPSLILINTAKGQLLFNEIKDELISEERTVEEAVRGNGRLISYPGKNGLAKLFEMYYPHFGFDLSVQMSEKTYSLISLVRRIKRKLKRKSI